MADSYPRDITDFQTRILEAAAGAAPADQTAVKRIIDCPTQQTVETITPSAASILFVETNKHNRDFALAKALRYAEQMKKGYWHLHHQGLAFYPNKSLADGQHRLAAVFLSGTVQPFSVFRDFEEAALEAIDIGTKRTSADAFGITQVVAKDDAVIAGPVVETVMKYEGKRLQGKTVVPSIYEQKDWATARMTPLQESVDMSKRLVRGRDSVLTKVEVASIALNLLLGGYELEFIESFVTDVLQSMVRYEGSPTVDLYRQYLKAKQGRGSTVKMSREDKLALAFRGASLAYRKATTSVKWRPGKEPLPSPSPPPLPVRNVVLAAAE